MPYCSSNVYVCVFDGGGGGIDGGDDDHKALIKRFIS